MLYTKKDVIALLEQQEAKLVDSACKYIYGLIDSSVDTDVILEMLEYFKNVMTN